MCGRLNASRVRDGTFKQGQKATEATAYFWKNVTQGAQDSIKGALTLDIGRLCTTPISAAKIIAGKCVIFLSGVVASASTCGNPLFISGTMSVARSIIKDL